MPLPLLSFIWPPLGGPVSPTSLIFSQITSSKILEIITFDEILSWFKERVSLKESDAEIVAFSLFSRKEEHYEIGICLFNKKTNEIIDAEKLISKQIDEKLTEIHLNDEFVIYE